MDASDLTKVKLIAAILLQKESVLEEALQLLKTTFSEIDFSGHFFPFTTTDYYIPEMGSNLQRGIISFTKLVSPGFLVDSKLLARDLEKSMSREGKRRVNIDVGYLDLFKVVLASFKSRSNKIYMDKGVWADMVLIFEKGKFNAPPWGFPDFKSGIYDKDLVQIRNCYKNQLNSE